jgi:hypothetical protein
MRPRAPSRQRGTRIAGLSSSVAALVASSAGARPTGGPPPHPAYPPDGERRPRCEDPWIQFSPTPTGSPHCVISPTSSPSCAGARRAKARCSFRYGSWRRVPDGRRARWTRTCAVPGYARSIPTRSCCARSACRTTIGGRGWTPGSESPTRWRPALPQYTAAGRPARGRTGNRAPGRAVTQALTRGSTRPPDRARLAVHSARPRSSGTSWPARMRGPACRSA